MKDFNAPPFLVDSFNWWKCWSRGSKARALAQYNSFNSWVWLDDVSCKNYIEVVCGDVRDPQFCSRECRAAQPL
jgi:hypothetical protein